MNKTNKTFFLILVFSLLLNLGWSAKLEVHAQNSANMLEEFHKRLKKGDDSINNLKNFSRSVADEIFFLSKNEAGLLLKKGGTINFRVGEVLFSIGQDFADMKSTYIHMDVADNQININKDSGTSLIGKDKAISISINGNSQKNSMQIKLDPDKNELVLYYGDSLVSLNKNGIRMGITKEKESIFLDKEKGLGIISKNITIKSEDNLNITAKGVVRINGKEIRLND